MRRASRQSGFVLVMTLIILVIAATLLAATARHSFQRALDAGARERDLQVRWGQRSCEKFFLDRAETVLKEPGGTDEPDAVRFRSVALGGMTFRIILSDEQAKANVNLLATMKTQETLAPRLRALQAEQADPLEVVLRPGKPVVDDLNAPSGGGPAVAQRPPARGPRTPAASPRPGVQIPSGSGMPPLRSAPPPPPRPATGGAGSGKTEDPPMLYASLDQVFVFDHPAQLVSPEPEKVTVVR